MNTLKVNIAIPSDMRNLNLMDYDLYGYLQGERCDKLQTLTINHFDEIELMHESVNAKTEEKFIHAIGIRRNTKRKSILIFKKR